MSLNLRLVLGLTAGILSAIFAHVLLSSTIPEFANAITFGLLAIVLLFFSYRWYVDLRVRIQSIQAMSVSISRDIEKQRAIANLMPLMRGNFFPFGTWAMEPVYLLDLLASMQAGKVDTVVECGAGVSTLLIGNLLKQKGQGHIYSLEEDSEWCDLVIRSAEEQHLEDYVTVVHAPLEPYTASSMFAGKWYSLSCAGAILDKISSIDFLIVDGPKTSESLSRFPALPVFVQKCDTHTRIVLDDTNRVQEQCVLGVWQETYRLAISFDQRAERHQAHITLEDMPGKHQDLEHRKGITEP